MKAHLIQGAFYLLVLLAVCVIPFAVAQRTTAKGNRSANIITVTNGNDTGPGSLRQALADANDGDTINFDPSVDIVTLTSAELAVGKSVTVSATPHMATVQRSSQTPFRIFHVMPGQNVTIQDLHITGGDAVYGGGILNDHANLIISNCSLTTNDSTYGYGGAIYSDSSGGNATLAVLNSSIIGNHAAQAGGGIYDNGGTLTITNSVVNNNTAFYSDNQFSVGDGGGIYNSGGALTITNSVVSNNHAGVDFPLLAGIDGQPYGRGGGISGSITLTNSTVSANYAILSGGGINGGGAINNSTLSGNNGGGISVTGALDIGDTVLKAGSGANLSNNGGTITSQGYNVCSDNGGGFLNGPGDQINTDPILGLLQDNGGPTFTHALLPGSPAIDAGDPNFAPPPDYDQRGPGFVRVFNGRIDVGSFEVQPTPTPTATATFTPTPTASSTATATASSTPTATVTVTATATATPMSTPAPTARPTPVPRLRPTPPPRP